MSAFEEGYALFEKQAGVRYAGYEGGVYVDQVDVEIAKLIHDLNAFEGFKTKPDALKGDIAEFWHANTFNINATARDTANRAFVDRSHDFASADISSNFEKLFGLKYYKTGADSAKQQAKSVFERFNEYKSAGGKDTLNVFLEKRGFTDDSVLHDPIYSGQVRVIPADQLKEACAWLRQKIATESTIRPEQMDRYHNSIDAIGDKAPTESKVFDACETAIQELSGILRIIVNELSGTNIFITADHGFLYTYKPLSESDKIDRKAFSGNVYELGRRYVLTAPDTTADFLLPVNLERELDGTPIKGYAPQDTIRMKVQGGGENYVHGGISLQELVVPVIAFKNLRTSNKNYVEVKNAELKLLSESRKISNLIFSLEFHQRQPVGDKIQPCTYSIYMTDDEGVVISDRQTVIADKTSDNAADRVFRVRFNLKAGTYDKKKVYRLVIANDIDVEEVEFHIDIAFADDFGFDL